MMKKYQNESSLDRAIRVVVGIFFLYVSYSALAGTVQILGYVLGTIALVTGISGFCAIYKLFKISTLKK